jgi:hypothetical protein
MVILFLLLGELYYFFIEVEYKMQIILCAFIKVFKKEEYREQFLDGSLYMNKLQFFIRIENQTTDGRNDPFESIYACFQPNNTTIHFGNVVL